MQRIELELNHNNLFCPVTGQRILSDGEPFEPSPAMLFCFIEDIEDFEFATDEIRNLYEKCLVEVEDNHDEYADSYAAFQKMVNEKLAAESNYVLITLVQRGITCGPVCMVVHMGFDMNYCSLAEEN